MSEQSESSEDLVWPDYFPADCPPADADLTSGDVYRIVAGNPPSESDFLHWREEFPDRTVDDKRPVASHGVSAVHMSCAMSVFRSEADGKGQAEYLAKMSGRLRECKVAVGTLTTDMGRIKKTPNKTRKTHSSWWKPIGVEVSSRFRIVA